MARTRIELFTDRAGKWRWRQRAANGKITETAQAYTSREHARRAARRRQVTMTGDVRIVVVRR